MVFMEYSKMAVLVTGYIRPKSLEILLDFLIARDFPILVSLDVPKIGNIDLMAESLSCIEIVNKRRAKLIDIRIAPENEGCFKGVTNAITWGFSKFEKLIIVEDDIEVGDKFLEFTSLMLDEFEANKDIGSIAGMNMVPSSHISRKNQSIRLSIFTSSWGWATWKDRWNDYLEDLKKFPDEDFTINNDYWNSLRKQYWTDVFQSVSSGLTDSWAYRWEYSNFLRDRMTIYPMRNLVLNRGFGQNATHTTDSNDPWWHPKEISTDFRYSGVGNLMERDHLADEWVSDNHYRIKFWSIFRNALYLRFDFLLKLRRNFR
jgi:hypothetical protein